MVVLAMRRQGMSHVEIGEQLGYHLDASPKWVKAGGPPPARAVAEEDRVVDPLSADRLRALLVGNAKLLATSLFEIIAAEGFDGSYPSVVRWAREQDAARAFGQPMGRRCRSRPRRATRPSSTSRTAQRGPSRWGSGRCCGASGRSCVGVVGGRDGSRRRSTGITPSRVPPGFLDAAPFPFGNRDPDAYEQPDEVVLDRRANRHFAFGAGIPPMPRLQSCQHGTQGRLPDLARTLPPSSNSPIRPPSPGPLAR